MVEDLQEDIGVEDKGSVLVSVGVGAKVAAAAGVMQAEDHDELVDGLARDHLPHGRRHDVAAAGVRTAVEDVFGRGVGRESSGGKDVHDQVKPKKVDDGEHGRVSVADKGGDNGQGSGRDIDRELELCACESLSPTNDSSSHLPG